MIFFNSFYLLHLICLVGKIPKKRALAVVIQVALVFLFFANCLYSCEKKTTC